MKAVSKAEGEVLTDSLVGHVSLAPNILSMDQGDAYGSDFIRLTVSDQQI